MKNDFNHSGPELNGPQDEQKFVDVNSLDMSEMFKNSSSKDASPIRVDTKRKNEELDQPVRKETTGLDSLAKNQDEIDRFYQSNIDKKWGLIDRWTNNAMYNQVQEVKKELFKTSAEYRLAFYKTVLDTRLEYLNEKCNAGLKMVKGHYRKEVSSFLMSKMEQLAFEVKDRQIAFLEMMKTKYQYAETLHNYPSMHERYLTSIFKEEEDYLKFLDGLIDKFQNILNEELKKYN